MSDWRARLNTWLAARSTRERWLVYGVCAVVIIALGDQLFTAPLREHVKSAQTQIESQRQAIAKLQDEVAQLNAQLNADPNRVLRERIDQLRAQHATLDEQLHQLTVGLIQPAEMTKVLREMLADEKGLRLVRLANGPAEPVLLQAPAAEGGKPVADSKVDSHLYRHTLVMEVEGGYLDAVRYLKRLEALPWTFYWEGVELNVEKYPTSRVTIKLSTLGLREGWIGV